MSKEIMRSIPGITFLREAKAELKKVAWPGKTQIWHSTLIVIGFRLSRNPGRPAYVAFRRLFSVTSNGFSLSKV